MHIASYQTGIHQANISLYAAMADYATLAGKLDMNPVTVSQSAKVAA